MTLHGLVRNTDPDTSHHAAARIAGQLPELQQAVYAAFERTRSDDSEGS